MPSVRLMLQTQSGSALVVTLLVMVAVTILGIMSINTSTVELKISRNEREVRETFYLAEGAAMEGIQRLVDTLDIDLNEQFQFWHHAIEEIEGSQRAFFRDSRNWDVDGQGEDNGLQSPMDSETFIAAIEWDVATGGSLIQTESRLYQNRIYGLCTKYRIDNLIEIGFKMRY